MNWTRLPTVGIALLLIACQRDGGIIDHSNLPGVKGTFVLEDDDRTLALSSVQHSIYYQVGEKRKLVFRGEAGRQPSLSMIGPDTILLRYCRGRISSVESSFFEQPHTPASEDLRILRLQVVTDPGLSVNGRSVC